VSTHNSEVGCKCACDLCAQSSGRGSNKGNLLNRHCGLSESKMIRMRLFASYSLAIGRGIVDEVGEGCGVVFRKERNSSE
jgi:hypothetical protein